MLEIAKYFVLGLAVLCFLGGVMGFVKAKSKASIIAGTISAVLLAGSFVLAGSQPTAGLIAASVVALLLEAHFGRGYMKNKKPMPAIPMLVSCLITQVVIIAALATGH